jgi:hypothetical protein
MEIGDLIPHKIQSRFPQDIAGGSEQTVAKTLYNANVSRNWLWLLVVKKSSVLLKLLTRPCSQ